MAFNMRDGDLSDTEFKPMDGEMAIKLATQLESGDMPRLSGMRIVPAPGSSIPHPFKCSKCAYTANTAAESRQHWFDEHQGE